METLLFAIVYLALAAERLFELFLNRRHASWLRAHGARWVKEDGFGLILASQVVLFGGVAAEVGLAPWAGEHRWTLAFVALLALAQVIRYWAITTLGKRWAIRVVTLPGSPRIVGGPYRWFPHPNYVAVMLEAIALPLAFGAWATLLVAAPLQLLALWQRIRIEERALGAAEPG